MKAIKLFLGLLFLSTCCYGQELNCVVQVNASQVQGTDRKVFETLQSSMFEFLNNRRWSSLTFSPQERIECSFTLIVQKREIKTNEISGSLTVQVRRPVFNSTYNSVLLNFVDKDISFQYAENDPLEYSDGTLNGNLTAIMAYYAYTALGLAFDSFGSDAGMSFFDRAMEIATQGQNFQSIESEGWKPNLKNNTNRYWLAENFTNGNLRDIHSVNYIYCRKGLDEMHKNPGSARLAILESLELLQKLNKQKSGLLCKQLFFDAHSEELINIFRMGVADEKNKFFTLMKELDPSGAAKYQEIVN